MTGEISLDSSTDASAPEGEKGILDPLESRVELLLDRFQEVVKQRDELLAAIDSEREKRSQLEKRLELIAQDREKVKTRIDQLLHRLKGIDF
jgi:uncharacterized coiled-coil DUF342 family protein